MIQEQEQSYNEGNQISVILFEVGWEQFALSLLDVKEIIQAGQIRRLPRSLDFIEGIYNYRGDIIHIVNLQRKLDLNEYVIYKNKSNNTNDEIEGELNQKKKFIIIVNISGQNIGFIVDRIINVAHIDVKDLTALSPVFQTSIGIEYIKGIIRFEDRPRILIDLNKVLSASEQITIQNELNSII
jgi:purine-binding chemotaxis protein CheW